MEDIEVVFDDWEVALASEISSDRRRPCREAIVKFRYWLRQKGKAATVATFKEHLECKAQISRYKIQVFCHARNVAGLIIVRNRYS